MKHDKMNDKLEADVIWILDSRVSHLMTPLRSITQIVKRMDKSFYINTPTGSPTLVESMGDIILSHNFILNYVFLVLEFKCNFIFIHKLITNLNL